MDVRQAKQKAVDYEEESVDENQHNGRRTESRLEKRRNNDVVDSYEYYG